MTRNRSKMIRFPIFDGLACRLIISRDVAATARRLRVNLDGCTAAFVLNTDTARSWIVLRPDASAGTIAHESSHAIRALFDFHGATLDDEAFAYWLDFLVTTIHKFMGR